MAAAAGARDRLRRLRRLPRAGAEREAVFPRAADRGAALALDEGSRTSAALAQILLEELAGVTPECEPLPIGCGLDSTDADAVLLIGDRAIQSGEPAGRRSLGPRREVVRLDGPAVRVCRLGRPAGCRHRASWKRCSRRPAIAASPILAEIAAAEAPALGHRRRPGAPLSARQLALHARRAGIRTACERFARLCADRGLVPQDAVRALDPTADPWLHEPITTAIVLDKAVAGERLTPAEGLALLESHDLAALGRAADEVTRRLHPENYRTYNIDRNINYTNVCTAVCDFCAFYRTPKIAEGYVLDRDELLQKDRKRRSSWAATRF